MNGWTVTIEAETTRKITEDALEELIDALAPYAASVGGRDKRLSTTMSVEAGSATTATALAERTLERAYSKPLTVVDVHVRTWAEHDRELARPAFPDLVGVAELAKMLGVSKQRASEARKKAGFPAPVAELATGPVWIRANVVAFAEGWKRTPGRPRKVVVEQPVKAPAKRAAARKAPKKRARVPA